MTTQTPADGGPVPPTGPAPQPGSTAGPAAGFFGQMRTIGLYRSDERWVGGVAGGLAARFGLDPLLVRGLFLVTMLLGGFGLVLYALAWALLPEERDGRIHLEGLTLGHPDVALLGALAMFVAGLGRGAWSGWPLGIPAWISGLFWLGATILVIVLVSMMLARRRPAAPRPVAGAMFGGAPYVGPSAPYGAAGPGFAGSGTAWPGQTGPSGPAAGPGYGPTTPAAYGPAPRMSAPVPPAATWAPAPAPAPYRYVAAPAPVRPPRPPRPPRRGPGATTVGLSVALSLFVVAGALVAQRAGWLDRSTAATAGALIVVILGVAVVVSGLRGRRGGVLGFLAVLAMIVTLPLAVTTRDGFNPWIVDRNGVHVTTTEGTTTFTDRTTAADGFRMGFGNATLDLTQLPLITGNRLTVPIDVSAGNLVVLVPRGAAVAARADIGAGQVRWEVGGDDTTASGVGRRDNFGVPADQASLWLQVHVGAGNVTIQEVAR